MKDKRYALKVKIKSLAAEAKIIRFEERKRPRGSYERMDLAEHRRGIVRTAARETLLAYGFLRGRSYESMEAKCHEAPNWAAVKKMVEKYGARWDGEESYQEFQARKTQLLKDFESWRRGELVSAQKLAS